VIRKFIAKIADWAFLTPPEVHERILFEGSKPSPEGDSVDHSSEEKSVAKRRWRPPAALTPSTLNLESDCQGLARPQVFDPALKQFGRAIRAGEPQFADEALARKWHEARMRVMHHVLDSIARTAAVDHLVLRGSAVMTSWFGDQARRPGDLDFVVTPQSLTLDARESKRLLGDVLSSLDGSIIDEELWIPADNFSVEEIWTYEKAPGQRVVVPWRSNSSAMDGTIQLDFVFGEIVPSEPTREDVCFGDLGTIDFPVASRQQSLAWKLVWLVTDCYAMGKDLYDAVLLAESITPELDLIRETFAAANEGAWDPFDNFMKFRVDSLNVEWDDFLAEYPNSGTEAEWRERLDVALQPLWLELESIGLR